MSLQTSDNAAREYHSSLEPVDGVVHSALAEDQSLPIVIKPDPYDTAPEALKSVDPTLPELKNEEKLETEESSKKYLNRKFWRIFLPVTIVLLLAAIGGGIGGGIASKRKHSYSAQG
jgi:hypothetical protein